MDFYLNNKQLFLDQTLVTEYDRMYKHKTIEFLSREENRYEIKPVFIYLPPNPLFMRIPDFVVLKVSLLKTKT